MGLMQRLGLDPARDFELTSSPGASGATDTVGVPDGMNVNAFRRKRFGIFTDHLRKSFAPGKPIRVLDIGGVVEYWLGTRDLWQEFDLDIVVVNLDAPEEDHGPIKVRPGNACNLSGYEDLVFDVVHSNSVIEHVGVWNNMVRMAGEVRRLAPHYFVQTPNFNFPLEPHFRTLFFHWYPESMRAKMMTRRARGFGDKKVTLHDAMQQVQANCLLNADQMQALFPDGRIEFEKAYGLKKSIMAIR